jgi:lactate dehydrogenase-like 2-hydroxyacid dehydrogenase
MRLCVAITHRVHHEVLYFLRENYDVSANLTPDTLAKNDAIDLARKGDGLMAFTPDVIDVEFLSACPRLRVVATASKRLGEFDVGAMTRRGIWFTVVHEPFPNPAADLKKTTRTLFTPRLGSAVADGRRMMKLRAAFNIAQALRGEIPRDAVNRPMRQRELAHS